MQVDGKVQLTVPPVSNVSHSDCCEVLKLLTVQKIDSDAILRFPLETLLGIADYFSVLCILALLEQYFIYIQPLKSPEYLAALKYHYGNDHDWVKQFTDLLQKKYSEISAEFIAESGIRPLKLKLRSVTRSRQYISDLQTNPCPCCKVACFYKPYERLSSSRGACTPCCGRFIHAKCIKMFVKKTFCPVCSTSLDEGKAFTEFETLHTTTLRSHSRDSFNIPRGATLPNLNDKYCLYKSINCNWDCLSSKCSDPLKPKFIITPAIDHPQNLQKQCNSLS
jgi:hypothetical protein